jgi:hypothetical protein
LIHSAPRPALAAGWPRPGPAWRPQPPACAGTWWRSGAAASMTQDSKSIFCPKRSLQEIAVLLLLCKPLRTTRTPVLALIVQHGRKAKDAETLKSMCNMCTPRQAACGATAAAGWRAARPLSCPGPAAPSRRAPPRAACPDSRCLRLKQDRRACLGTTQVKQL